VSYLVGNVYYVRLVIPIIEVFFFGCNLIISQEALKDSVQQYLCLLFQRIIYD